MYLCCKIVVPFQVSLLRVALQLGLLTSSRTFVLGNADTGTLALADYSYSAASIMFLARADLAVASSEGSAFAPDSSAAVASAGGASGSRFQQEVAARMRTHDWAAWAGHSAAQKVAQNLNLSRIPLLSASGNSPQIPVP